MDKNLEDYDGNTPLHIAALNGHSNVCKTLIEGGVQKNLRNNNGKSPLNFAALKSHYKVTHFFSEFFDDKEVQDKLMKVLSE